MSIKKAPRIVTVSTTPTPLRSALSGGALYYYASGGPVRLGNTLDMTMTSKSVTFPAAAQFNDSGQGQVYAIVAAGTTDVEVWETEN